MRHLALPLALLLALAASPAVADEPAQAPAPAADIDRLLDVMDMETMMAGMMQQMSVSQQAMMTEAFGSDLSEQDRQRMQALMARSDAIIQKHLAWPVLEPVVRNVYAKVFTAGEVAAMTRFYSSAEGAAILRKSPQAAALTMQELQPVMVKAMEEVKAAIREETQAAKD